MSLWPARRRGRGNGAAVHDGAGGRRGRIALLVAIALGAGMLGAFARHDGARAQEGESAEQVFALRIEGGKIADDVRSLRVTQGDRVRLRWTADAPTVLHLHGYDVEREVVPGRVTEMHLEAYATGRFPIEAHGADHSDHEEPLLFLEVYPP